jgi:hypothetical protein
MRMKSLFVAFAAATVVLTVKAGPFAPPQPVADAPLPAALTGAAVTSDIAGFELNGVASVLSLSSQLDRLVFHPSSPGPALVIDVDLRGGSR